MGIFARISGLPKLTQRYPVTQPPAGTTFTHQTVKVGSVRYRRCVTVAISEQGLYLGVHPPLGQQGVMLIPWGEVKGTQRTKLYGRRAMRLSIGAPQAGTITVYEEMFQRIAPYLGLDVARSR